MWHCGHNIYRCNKDYPNFRLNSPWYKATIIRHKTITLVHHFEIVTCFTLHCSILIDLTTGEIGDWKNYFTDAQNEAFDALYKEKLAGTGLEFDFEWIAMNADIDNINQQQHGVQKHSLGLFKIVYIMTEYFYLLLSYLFKFCIFGRIVCACVYFVVFIFV